MKSLNVIFAIVAAAAITAGAQERTLIASTSGPSNGPEIGGNTPAVIPIPCQVSSDATMVQERLLQFDSALASHDLNQLEATGIQPVSLKRWQKFFKDNPDATVTDRCPIASLFIMDDNASWNCIETTTIGTGKKQTGSEHMIHFAFARKNGAWMISDRR